MKEGSFTENLAPKQGLALQATMPVIPEVWAAGTSDEVTGRGLAASSRALGKAPIMQAGPVPLAKTDKGLACWP